MPKMPADWIESTPEWKACFGLIDDEEYLRLTANYGREITPEHRANLLKRKQCTPKLCTENAQATSEEL